MAIEAPAPRPLSELDDVPWETLEHYGGSAAEVPTQLRALASADPRERHQAYAWWHRRYDQGNLYQATPYMVPFLLHLLADESAPEPEELLDCLNDLIAPDVVYWLDDCEGGFHQWIDCGYNQWIIEYGDYDRATIDALRANVHVVAPWLDNHDPKTAGKAARFLTWFRHEADSILPGLRRLCDRRLPRLERADTLVALGMLTSGAGAPPDVALLQQIIADRNDTCRWAAGVALAITSTPDIPAAAIDAMVDELSTICTDPDEYDTTSRSFIWGADIGGLIVAILSRLPESRGPHAQAAIAQAFTGPHANGSVSQDFPATLVGFALYGAEQLDPASLTTWQRTVLQAALATPQIWQTGRFGAQLAEHHGLPNTHHGLQEWLAR